MKLWFKKTNVEPKPSKESSKSTPPQRSRQSPSSEDTNKLDGVDGSQSAAAGEQADAASKPLEIQPNSRELFKALFDGLYDASIVTDIRGYIFNMNARVTDVLGYEPDDLWDTPISHVAPGITDAVIARIKNGLADERHAVVDARCRRKDQTIFPAEISISSINLTKDGNLLFCIRNTERRQMELTSLRLSRRLLDHLAAPAVACDSTGRIKVANKSIAKMLGYDNSEILLERPLTQIWREDRAQDVINRVLSGETIKEPITMVNTRGKQLKLVLSLVPDTSPSQKIVGFLASFTASSVVSLTAKR